MSRRKRDARARPVAKPSGDAPATGHPPTAADTARFRWRFLMAVALTAVWWAALIALVVFTANPVTLNRRQLRSATQIVTAEVVDAAEGKVKVLKNWSGSDETGELHVEGLQELGVRDGKTYILPLTLTARGGWQVTPAPDSPDRHPVYPATDAAVEQLAKIVHKDPNR